ncbi:magnesium transporter [Engelhardtia mirabilis]|uniref:Magnesium transporter MgtE n=1 Tax=Engelhardtia mirabilis TaxID=2528011 RepID=A0A518BPR3_9BACT|nr:Magnesium transporter MgtE [Planctomycetes bacterium Pla133]QDV03298.1 Magnesium transporter MgtE [Planctomycetes bacterium Pla86]
MTEVVDLRDLLRAGDGAACAEWLKATPSLDTVRVLARLSDDEREGLLNLLEPAAAAEVLESLPEPQALEALESLEPSAAARILEELSSDEQADLIGELDAGDAEAILVELGQEEAESVRRLAAYEDDQAGGLMVTEFLAYPGTHDVAAVLVDLAERAEDLVGSGFHRAFVVDDEWKLIGSFLLRDLVLTPRRRRLVDLMQPDFPSVTDVSDIAELAPLFRETDYSALPVVDDRGRLIGVVKSDDLERAMVEESDETYRASQGIVGGEELRSMPLAVRSRRRLAWLSTNVLLNIAAACVIAAHQDTLEAVIALAVFLPIISDMSGCSGNQAVAVSMREMSLGILRPSDALSVLGKELSVGLVNGVVLGVMVGSAAWIWKGNPYLGLVVGGALTANTLVAVAIGGTVPLLLRRFGMDPALASGPILTTLTDMCGFLLVLGTASALLSRLT